VPRTHSLAELLALIVKIDPSFLMIQTDLIPIEGYAVQFSYPGFSAEKNEARQAVLAAERVRTFVRNKLGLNP
jgi:HEPN domain-containing protein